MNYNIYSQQTNLKDVSEIKEINKDRKIVEITNFSCKNGEEDCKMINTICKDTKNKEICHCKREYYAINPEEDGKTHCSSKRPKKQLTAFLLELFITFGAGHFYRNAYTIAILKLFAFIFGIYIICLFPLTAKCVSDCTNSDCVVIIVSAFFYLCSCALAFWFVYDLVKFGKNQYKDKNGIGLISWKKD